jgi:uncharacterized protein YgiM (DUF1202 family)
VRKVILTIIVLIALLFIFLRFLYKPLSDNLGLKVHAGIFVEADKNAQVLINGNEVGMTPYKDTNLSEGNVKVTVKDASSSAQWEGNVKLNSGTLTVVNRDVATDSAQASGEVISLDKGSGVTVTSNPPGATVVMDGENKGQTPVYIPNVPAGEHQFLLSKDNYLKRSVRTIATDGYGISLNVDLAQLEMVQQSPPPVAASAPPTSSQVTVIDTPTGFLRVRDAASTSGNEVSQVKPGDTLTLEEETNSSWWKIKTSDGKEGYVSTQYVHKK